MFWHLAGRGFLPDERFQIKMDACRRPNPVGFGNELPNFFVAHSCRQRRTLRPGQQMGSNRDEQKIPKWKTINIVPSLRHGAHENKTQARELKKQPDGQNPVGSDDRQWQKIWKICLHCVPNADRIQPSWLRRFCRAVKKTALRSCAAEWKQDFDVERVVLFSAQTSPECNINRGVI